uniref:Myb/SANT-like DNA-binding domain-containing protein n=1 Tax=Magallana gigas TaxID=29159 RepID=A0A8W8J2G6_MAGGI
MKGAGAKGKHGKIKEETWHIITDRLNSQFRNERTSDSISKKYDNIKQRAKDKIDRIRRPKTGGGPPPALLTQAEEALYQAMDTRPTIVGLVGGIDTDEPLLCTKQPQEICHSIVAMEDCPTAEASGDALSSSNGRFADKK